MSWNTQKRNRWLISIGVLALLLFGPGIYEYLRLSMMQRKLDRRLADLASEGERLTQEEERLRSDPAYVEGLIRSTFKLAQPGEYVIPIDSTSSRAVKSVTRTQ